MFVSLPPAAVIGHLGERPRGHELPCVWCKR